MTTRDSHGWYIAAGAAWLASLAANPAQVEKLLELNKSAWVSALCSFAAIVAALMKASPLPISDEGREKYLSDTVKVRE